MLCMLRQERSIAQAKLCQNAHQFGKLWRETFNLNQESGQANLLLLHLFGLDLSVGTATACNTVAFTVHHFRKL